ncbi:MAG: signal peptidase I [Actinobacteria bacterium]|nr:signal peptidase I [Actinomycetota bacterium]
MSKHLPEKGRDIPDKEEFDLNPRLGALGPFSDDLSDEQCDSNPGTKEKDSFISFVKELPLLIIAAVVIALVIKWFFIQPFYIPSRSMEPTLVPNDLVLVSKFIYKFASPKTGDIIVFIPPDDKRDFIKRIVATEGDIVQVRNGELFINGKVAKQDYETMPGDFDNWGPGEIPEDHVFVMGDNRPNSHDGRKFGPVPESSIIGRAFMVYWPPGHIKLLVD